MANDIDRILTANPIKNGSAVVGCKTTGFSDKDILNTNVINTPTITDIEAKFDNRFYNGIFVNIVGSGIIGV